MKIINYICQKLADLEKYLNEMPIEKRKGFTIKVGIILLILLFIFAIGGNMIRSYKFNERKEKEEVSTNQRDIDSMRKQLDEELNEVSPETKEQTKKALQLIDSLSKLHNNEK